MGCWGSCPGFLAKFLQGALLLRVSVCPSVVGRAYPSLPLGRPLPWSPGGGGASLRKFRLFRFSEVLRSASSFSFSFYFRHNRIVSYFSWPISVFSVSELHYFGVSRFSLAFFQISTLDVARDWRSLFA